MAFDDERFGLIGSVLSRITIDNNQIGFTAGFCCFTIGSCFQIKGQSAQSFSIDPWNRTGDLAHLWTLLDQTVVKAVFKPDVNITFSGGTELNIPFTGGYRGVLYGQYELDGRKQRYTNDF